MAYVNFKQHLEIFSEIWMIPRKLQNFRKDLGGAVSC